jgi:sodium/potassium/calcium exchanger 2
VFIAKSDVGTGTIVGSAVFNVLFVIAACAFASVKALSLTAWPLIRDTTFYSVALGLLVGFFSDAKVIRYQGSLFLEFNTNIKLGDKLI